MWFNVFVTRLWKLAKIKAESIQESANWTKKVPRLRINMVSVVKCRDKISL